MSDRQPKRTDQTAGDTERTARYSDPITERGGLIGRGAVLYDTRDPHARPCCARPGGRCLAHVVGVYEETTTGEVYYKVADGTWTTEEWIHGDDLLALFEPAGWSVTGVKPTYLLTREHGVEDHHDLMTDGGTREEPSTATDHDKDGHRFGPWRYVSKIRVQVDRQRIETGHSLDSFDDRLEAEIDSETVFVGFRQISASDIGGSLPVVDTSDLPPAGDGVDMRAELLTDGGEHDG